MIAHSVDAALQAPPSAYETAYYSGYAGETVRNERPLQTLVASNAPLAGGVATPQHAAGVAPCAIQHGYPDTDWNAVVAECNGRQMTVGRPTPARVVRADSAGNLLTVVLFALAALGLLFAAQAFSGGRASR